jgi:hypothetical protein
VCQGKALELRAVAETNEQRAGTVDFPAEASATPPNPWIGCEVAGDQAGTYAAERI